MGKCTCSIHAASPFGATPLFVSEEVALKKLHWPVKCLECGSTVASPEGTVILNTRSMGIQVICSICEEVSKCFLCSCDLGQTWHSLKRAYHSLPLGSLTELLSPEAKAVLIERADEWIEEDE